MRMIDADALKAELRKQDEMFYEDRELGYPVSHEVFLEIDRQKTIEVQPCKTERM